MLGRAAAELVMAVAWVTARLPVFWTNALGRGAGWLASYVTRGRRRIAIENVVRALPDHDAQELVGDMYRHLGLVLVEVLRAVGGRPPPITFEGREHLDRALEQGRGVIIMSGHVGNFELLVHAADRMPVPVHLITKQFSSPVAESIWRRTRREGPNLLSARRSGRAGLRALDRNEILVFVLDQHMPTRSAVWVPFFGRPAATSRDVVRLAHRSGAAIIPMFTWRRAHDHLVEVSPALELGEATDEGIEKDTARCVALVEAAIRREPHQWFWIHRRWKKPPDDLRTRS